MNSTASQKRVIARVRVALWSSCLVGVALCASASADFLVDSEVFASEVRRLAVQPTRVQIEVGDARAAAATFDRLIEEALSAAGVDYIPASAFVENERRIATTMGGSFDVYTGEQDIEKARAITDLAIREFERTEEFDAYLIPAVVRVNTFYENDVAAWDGVERPPTGKKEGFLSGTNQFRGYLGAASLMLTVIDKTEADKGYYVERGGIELLVFSVPPKMFQTFKLRVAPRESRLQDEAANREAVEIALSPLLSALATAGGPEGVDE